MTLRIVEYHGEHESAFYVVDADAPESEQPCVVYSAYSRDRAERFMADMEGE